MPTLEERAKLMDAALSMRPDDPVGYLTKHLAAVHAEGMEEAAKIANAWRSGFYSNDCPDPESIAGRHIAAATRAAIGEKK